MQQFTTVRTMTNTVGSSIDRAITDGVSEFPATGSEPAKSQLAAWTEANQVAVENILPGV